MGTKPRARPDHLGDKLLAIRTHLELSQSQLARRLDPDLTSARISEYEHGTREPALMVLLRYSELARVSMEVIINDRIDLTQFGDALCKHC